MEEQTKYSAARRLVLLPCISTTHTHHLCWLLLGKGARAAYFTVGRVTMRPSVPSMQTRTAPPAKKGSHEKRLVWFLQIRCHNSFQPLKHQLYHIKPPLTINIRLWEVFVLGVHYGAFESLLIHVLQEKLIVRDASAATSLAFIEITAWRTILEPPPPPPPPPQISLCRRRRRCCRHYSSHTQSVLCRSEK
eukprot:COSAG01_NODE_1928_length_8876_cov_12.801641_1_plen_191_part_00